MLLSNKMKYIGVSCGILPSNIIRSIIDIAKDFIPYRNNKESISIFQLMKKNHIIKSIDNE